MTNEFPEGNILEKLIAIKSSLPNKQKQLCTYILENQQEMSLLTVKELASNAGVGTTTVMRLIKLLGYDSFFDMKKDFYHIQVEYSDKWDSVQKSFGESDENESYVTLSSVAQESISLIEKSVSPHLVENFELAMDLIANAERINLLGLRPYRAVAIYLEILIEEFYSKTRQLSNDSDTMIDRILQFNSDEVLVLFGFAPYTQRTIDAAMIAHRQKVPIVLITDYLSCPLAPYAEVILRVEPSEKHFTVVPVIALVEAIVIELGRRNSRVSIQRIRRLVETLKEKNIITE